MKKRFKISFFLSIIFISIAAFLPVTYAQDKDSKWVSIWDTSSSRSPYNTVRIETSEKYITYYPLKEVSFWIYAPRPYINEGREVTGFVMSRIRFGCYTGKYTVMATYQYLPGHKEMVEVSKIPFLDGWKKFFENPVISRRLWKYANDYFK